MSVSYMLVGNCKMRTQERRGLTVYRYDPKTAALSLMGGSCPEMNIGHQSFHPETGLIYVLDEQLSQPGQTGGGGNAAAFRLDPASGALECISFHRTYAANPAFQCTDLENRFMIVAHHATEEFVTKLVHTKDGGFDTQVCYDDCLLVLLALSQDGGFSRVCDVVAIPGNDGAGPHRFPHLHCVRRDHTGRYYLVTDKGMRKIYVYTIDMSDGRLVKVSEINCPGEAEARYGVFDPERQIFYVNFEDKLFVCAYSVNGETGQLELLSTEPAAEADCDENPMTGDIAIHPSGRYLYITIRTLNLLSVLELDRAGGMKRRQVLSCGGQGPRGLCVSADGRFVFTANTQSQSVFAFSVRDDGTLEPVGTVAAGGFPGNLQIISFD